MATYYTIAGIEDDKYPPDHPDVFKFFDRASAQSLLDTLVKEGMQSLEHCHVAEHTT